MPLTDPVPSSSFDVLQRNVQDTDKFVNQETGTFTNRVGKVIKPIPVIENEANAAVISLGWSPVGEFSTGFTYTKLNDVGRDSSGSWWRYNGSDLPKVITAGTVPSSPNFSVISFETADNVQWESGKSVGYALDDLQGFTDELLAQAGIYDDGFPDSIGNSKRVDSINKLSIKRISESGGYHVLNSDIALIPTEINQLTKIIQALITGDSLSFNGFGYPSGWGVSGSAYATDNPFGMSSWAHMLRDLWVTSGFFQPISGCKFYSNANGYPAGDIYGYQHFAINQRALVFELISGSVLKIESKYSGASSLLISTQPAGASVTFDINGVNYSTLSESGDYQGFEFKLIPFNGNLATINNVVSPTSGTRNLIVYGIVPSATKIPKLTGKGAWTSTQILEEYSTLVEPYLPDVIFYIIGANDAGAGSPDVSGYNASVRSFIDLARSDKPDCVIVLISMPATSTYSDSLIEEYVRAGEIIALEKGCSHIDLFSATKNIDPDYWRFDNIHANDKGDTLWFNIFKELLFNQVSLNDDKFVPVREAILGVGVADLKRGDESVQFVIQMTPTTPTITDLKTSLAGIVSADYIPYAGEYTCRITAPVGFKVSSVVPLVVSAGETSMLRQFQKINSNDMLVRATGISNNTSTTVDGSFLYGLVTITRDTSVI